MFYLSQKEFNFQLTDIVLGDFISTGNFGASDGTQQRDQTNREGVTLTEYVGMVIKLLTK
jgi:hypothetical protein